MKVSISKEKNAQFSNSVAFGQSLTHSNGGKHCIDESAAEAAEVGATLENNGQKTDSSTRSSSKSKTHSRHHSSTVSAKASFGFDGFGAEFGTSTTNSVGQSETNTNGRSDTKFESAGWRKENSQKHSASHSLSSEICKDKNKEHGATSSTDRTRSGGEVEEISFDLPGNKEAIENSQDVVKASKFISATSGSIAVRNGLNGATFLFLLSILFFYFISQENHKILTSKLNSQSSHKLVSVT